MSDHLWYPEIVKALTTSSHLFVHYCAFHRVDSSGEVIHSELTESGYSCQTFRLDYGTNFEGSEDFTTAVLVGMERLIEKPRALEHLRVAVNNWAAQGADRKVVILSGAPRSAYPVGDGSSLVLDSKDLHLRGCRFGEWIIGEYERVNGALPFGASASRGLASAILAAGPEVSIDVPALASEIACRTLFELGPSYIALLDEWAIEGRARSVSTVDVPEWMQVELILAGVARLDLDQQNLLLFDCALGPAWLEGLRQASRRCVAAPKDWRDLAACLFELERMLRHVLSAAFEASLGSKWAKQVVRPDGARYILESAGVPPTFPLHELANPLDYMTLGQLIDLADSRSEAAAAGLSTTVRLELRRVVPIRNRVGHMRLPRMGDLHAARSALRLLDLAVQGSRQRIDQS